MKENTMRLIALLTLILTAYHADSQNITFIKNISFEYGAQIPLADLSERFGSNFQAGGHFEFISTKNLVTFGISGHYIFGSEVKEDVLTNLRTSDEQIIGNDRQFATVFLRERGFNTQIYLGKIFRITKNHPISGIKSTIGLGLLQHKIRIQDDSRSVTELTGEYLKGYDRLSNGLSLNAFLGYQHMDRQGRINILAGFDFALAFTKNRRDYDFATLSKIDRKRLDALGGFKIGWMLTIGGSRVAADQIIY